MAILAQRCVWKTEARAAATSDMLNPETTTMWVVPEATRANRRLSGMPTAEPTSRPVSRAACGSGSAC